MAVNCGKPRILIVGANPSWQKTLVFDEFTAKQVNRAESMHIFASGKGINAARAVATWHQAECKVLQFAGGDNGRDLVVRLQADDIKHVTVKTQSPTRMCTTCLDKMGNMTELIEPAEPPSTDEIDKFLAFFHEMAGDFDGILICGTAPGKNNSEFYELLANELAYVKCPVLADGNANMRPLLESGHVSAVKINREELATLVPNEPNVETALKKLCIDYDLNFAAVTDEAAPAYLATPQNFWRYTLPKLEKVVNPLGSGDTCNAVLLTEVLRGCAVELAFKAALAAASANCLTLFCGHFPVANAAEIYSEIIMEQGE